MGIYGKTANEMFTPSSYSGFNFTSMPSVSGNNWVMVNVDGSLATSGQQTASGTLPMLASEFSTKISNAHQLQLMQLDLAANYTIGQNIDASNTNTIAQTNSLITTSKPDVWGDSGFIPVGFNPVGSIYFSGKFTNPSNYVINGLTINLPNATHPVALISNPSYATIDGIRLTNIDITGNQNTGALVGYADFTNINNSSVEGGTIRSTGPNIGGLVGEMGPSTLLSKSYASV
jgi:hypothetical protein